MQRGPSTVLVNARSGVLHNKEARGDGKQNHPSEIEFSYLTNRDV